MTAVMFTVLVAACCCSSVPSLATQVIVRLVSVPKLVGLSLVEEKVTSRAPAGSGPASRCRSA